MHSEHDDGHLKEENFRSLLTFCERFLCKTDANINTVVSDVFRSFQAPPAPTEHLLSRQPTDSPAWLDYTLPDDFVLPTANFENYQIFQDDVFLEHDLIDRPYRIILDFAGKLTGLPPYKLHEIVQRLHEFRKLPTSTTSEPVNQ